MVSRELRAISSQDAPPALQEALAHNRSVDGGGIAVFTYDFPHKKTQDLLLRLIAEHIMPTIVIGAPRAEIPTPISPPLRVKPRHIGTLAPQVICKSFGVPYFVAPHNSELTCVLLRDLGAKLGIIGGARILARHVISVLELGILNLHPGILPEVRGLDALQWAVYKSLPLGVTAHLIDEHIDAGRMVTREIVPEYRDDLLVDLSLRLEEAQIAIASNAVRAVLKEPRQAFVQLRSNGEINAPMRPELYGELLTRLEVRLHRQDERTP